MPSLADLTAQLAARRDLSPDQAEAAAAALAAPEVPDPAKADFLTALARKGESAAEVAAFAQAFRARMVDPGVGAWAAQAIDIVGTGGDHAGGFNISTLVVLVLASSGVPVMKHGNRGITSRCGSADLFANLGVDLEAKPQKQQAALAELGFAFFFAPAYHPAFRHIGPVRKALAAQGQRTVFNILGPLLNPGRPARSLVGVFAESWVDRLAGALTLLGSEAGLVGHGILGPDRGIDELTTATVNRVKGIGRLASVGGAWTAADFGLPAADFAELKGGDLPANRALIDSLLAGRGPAGLADTIALNASVALWICGRTQAPAEGVAQAKEALVGGAVRRKIEATREFFRS
ncbi:MAG TPA: anthranilate phosphoribosyltransferase [Opitutaceae bacterium]|jgi:anthranilate phosphoribosyltransferase|nr:anthranilate phosphoribosyltransferase [Opitutaceae bacterium]